MKILQLKGETAEVGMGRWVTAGQTVLIFLALCEATGS